LRDANLAATRASARGPVQVTAGDRAPDLILLGRPGSGKSTQAARLAEHLGLVHLDPGTIFRDIVAEPSAIGQQIRDPVAEGRLVPDDVTDEVIRERVNATPPERGVVLSGYPRNAGQAEALHRLLAESGRLQTRPVVVQLDVPNDELVDRLRRRRDLQDRGDDSDEVTARRLETYDAETAPVADAVSDWADVMAINGSQPAEAVTTEILEKLDAKRGAAGRNGDDRAASTEARRV
jgi:adenylate kinase